MKIHALLVSSLAALLAAGCHHPVEQAEAGPKVTGEKVQFPENSPQLATLSVESVQSASSAPVRLNGRLVWNDEVTTRMFTPFGGRVVKIVAEAGQTVKAGDTLALIASSDFGQAQADARKAATDFAQAGKTLSRLRELSEHGAAAQKDLQAAESDFARAQAEKERSAKRLSLYGANASDNDSDQIFVLRAPIDGVVVEKNINPGQEVRPDAMMSSTPQFAAPLFVISDPSKLWVLLDASETDLGVLKSGESISIHSRVFPEQTFEGRVEVVSDSLDPATRTIKVRGSLANAQRSLKAEMFVTVDVAAKPSRVAAVDVPARAVFLKGEKHFVFVEESAGQFARREVKAGPEIDGRIAVLDGLQPGQRIVTNGCMLLEQVLTTEGGI